MKKEKKEKAKQGEHETISLQALFICLCAYVYACAISSLVLLTSNINMGLIMKSTLPAMARHTLSWVPTTIVKINKI